MNKTMKAGMHRILSILLVLASVLGTVPMIGAEKSEEEPFVLPTPVLSNTSTVRYWGFNSSAEERTGLSPSSPARYLSDLSSDMSDGGTVVISDKGWISDSKTFSPRSTVLFTGKDTDGTYYYDPSSPNVTQNGQVGMFMINNSDTWTLSGQAVFADTVILERNADGKLSTLNVASDAVLHIKETVLFASSVSGPNTKLNVDEGGIAILESAGFSSYTGSGTIYIDPVLFDNGAVGTDDFDGFEGEIYNLSGEYVCDHTGIHNIYTEMKNGKYYQYCAGCDLVRECTYTVPKLENTSVIAYWAYTGLTSNDGKTPQTPKPYIANIAGLVSDGGTAVVCGKGYISQSTSIECSSVVKITAIDSDGTDYREASPEYGSVIVEGGHTFSIRSDMIFEHVNIYSRKTEDQIFNITNGSTVVFDDVKCKVSNSSYNKAVLNIEAGSTVILRGDNAGSFSRITGRGILAVDAELIKNGRFTKEMIEGFEGAALDLDCQPLVFPAESGKEDMSAADVYSSGSFKASDGTTLPYRYYIPADYSESKEYPVVLYLHGNGSRGSDNVSQLNSIGAVLHNKVFKSSYDCIIIAPQCPTSSMWTDTASAPGSSAFIGRKMGKYLAAANELFDSFVSEYSTDKDRYYIIGSSCGGAAAWELIYNYPDKFAAAIPMAGALEWDGAAEYAKKVGNTAIWTFHGTDDKTCNVEATRAIVRELAALGKNITYTEVKGATHNNIWVDAADEPGIVEWLFGQARASKLSEISGDINRDRALDGVDITLLVRHLSGWNVGYSLDCADMNSDGKISNRDAITLISKYASSVNGVPNADVLINSIAVYNGYTSVDSHADDTQSSMLEMNFRESYTLDKSAHGLDEVYYTRIKKLADGTYIMFYQDKKTGKSIYYAVSPDMKNWTPRGKLFAAVGKKWYATADALVLSNGDIIVVTSFNTSYNGDPMGNGIALKRSTNNGKTWSSEKIIYRGTTWEPSLLQLWSGEIQIYWTNTHVKGVAAELGGRVDDTSTGTMMIRSFDNGASWTSDTSYAYSGQIVAQQLTKTGSDGNYYSGQMPSAVQLNNGNIVLALEVRVPKPSNPTTSTYHLAFAYSPGVNSWPKALGTDEQGPTSLVPNAMTYKAGPNIRQFISGETLLTFHWSAGWFFKFGNSTATEFYDSKDQVFFENTPIHQWGGIEITDTHVVTGIVNSADFKYIYIGNRYLNHTLTAVRSSVGSDGFVSDWTDSKEAFFVGSESQAQSAIRVKSDKSNMYFYIETLDRCVTDMDRVSLRLSAQDSSKYIEVVVYANGSMAFYDKNGKLISADGVKSRVQVNGTYNIYDDEDVGYVIELKVPKTLFGTGSTVCFAPTLYNKDGQYDLPIKDTLKVIDMSDKSTWLKIKVQ